jgi:preprotein translocase subunit YajC
MAASAAAQTNATAWNTVKALPAGTEVRIAAGSHTVRGKIDRITDDTLVVTSGDGQEMFAQQEVTRVSVGKQGHRGRNALIGLGIGAGAGLGVGAAADAGCNGICFLGDLGKEVFTPVGAVAGVLLGALIPTGGWREIYKK